MSSKADTADSNDADDRRNENDGEQAEEEHEDDHDEEEGEEDEDDRKPAAKDGSEEPARKKRRRRRVISTLQESKWQQMYQRLIQYKDKYGNALVPNRYAEDTSLGAWVATQRRNYRVFMSGSDEPVGMTAERIRSLEAIGFQWTTTDPRHEPWEVRYEELKAFVHKYGHAEIPMRWEENVQLSNWVSKQRQDYKLRLKDKSTRLTDERMRLLNELGFKWHIPRKGRKIKQKAIPVIKNSTEGEDSHSEDDLSLPASGGEEPPALTGGVASNTAAMVGSEEGAFFSFQQITSPTSLPASLQAASVSNNGVSNNGVSNNGAELPSLPAVSATPAQQVQPPGLQATTNPGGIDANVALNLQNALAALTGNNAGLASLGGQQPAPQAAAPVNIGGQGLLSSLQSALLPQAAHQPGAVLVFPIQLGTVMNELGNILATAQPTPQVVPLSLPLQPDPAAGLGLPGLVFGIPPPAATPAPSIAQQTLASQLINVLAPLAAAPQQQQPQPHLVANALSAAQPMLQLQQQQQAQQQLIGGQPNARPNQQHLAEMLATLLAGQFQAPGQQQQQFQVQQHPPPPPPEQQPPPPPPPPPPPNQGI